MNQASMPRPSGAGDHTRYGTVPLRIGATIEHKLTQRLVLHPSGRILTPGQKLHTDVQDITGPKGEGTEPHTVWVCRNPDCAGRTWKTKLELLRGHPDNRELKKSQQVHLYYAVAHMPAVAASAEVLDKQGNVTSEAVAAKPASLLLLSDEE